VVLGGDGMAHLAAQALALGDTPLGIVPAGTGNDIADVLACRAIRCARPTPYSPPSIAARSAGSTSADGHRTMVGHRAVRRFDSAVTERANRLRWPRDRVATTSPLPRKCSAAAAAVRLRPTAAS